MKKIGFILATAALFPQLPALAHHSFVAFDEESEITVTGTVTDFRFVNPHTYFFMDVTNDAGETINFRVEGETRNDLYRNGWRDDTLIVGDVVSVTVNPARDANRRYGRLLSLVKADGTFLDIPNEEDEAGRRNRVPAASLEGVWLPVQTFREMFARIEPLGTERARAEQAQMADTQSLPVRHAEASDRALPVERRQHGHHHRLDARGSRVPYGGGFPLLRVAALAAHRAPAV